MDSEFKCPFCGGNESEWISTDYLTRNTEQMFSSQGMIRTESGHLSLPIVERLCLSCGQVLKSINKESLMQYHDKKAIIKNRWI